MKTYLWMSLALVLGLNGAVQAQPPYAYGPGVHGSGYGPAAPIGPAAEAAKTLREGIDKLLAFAGQEEKPNRLQAAAFLDREIAPYFDFARMAQWVAGPRYAAMNEEQREAMTAALESRFLTALASKLTNYQGQQVRYLRPRSSPRGAVSVSVGILRPGSYPSKLDFRMYQSEDGWKVYDVVANGRSAVAFYRAELNRPATPAPSAAGPGVPGPMPAYTR